MKISRRPASRAAAGACSVAVIVTATHAGGRWLLLVRGRDDGKWRRPERAAAPGGDVARQAVAVLAEDAAFNVDLASCQPRPPRSAGVVMLPREEPKETLIPVLVPLGEVGQLPPVAPGGRVLATEWFPAANYPAVADALTAAYPGWTALWQHEQLLALHLGLLPVSGPDDRPDLVADFIRRGHELGILEFLVSCGQPETFAAAVMATPGYGRFRPAAVARALGAMFGEFMHAEVGTEGGRAVIYMHLPYYDSQRYKNRAALAAAAADLSFTGGPGELPPRRELDGLVTQAVREGLRLGADEAAGVEEPVLGAWAGVRKVRFWWH